MTAKPAITKVIEIRNLSKIYKLYDRHIDRLKEALHPFKKHYHRPFYALKNINLEVKKGEILGIVGRNGAGKSTLAKIISGVVSPSQGICKVRGRLSSLLGLASGFNPELTGIENIYLNGTIKGFTKKEMDGRLDDIIAFADIGQFINQPLKNYSSGMQARLGFAVAININPQILVLDEVLAVGDELFKRKCYNKMEELFKSGCSVIFVSHSMPTIQQICTRTVFMDAGELLLTGPPKLVTQYYMKYLYSTRAEQKEIKREMREINKSEQAKENFSQSIAASRESLIEEGTPDFKPESFFVPNFQPKTTMKQKFAEVEFLEPAIYSLKGEEVNHLVLDESYLFSFKIKFGLNKENLKISILFQGEKGLHISGITFPEGQNHGIERVNRGESYLVKHRFKCCFLPGIYYIGMSVSSTDDSGNHKPLIRINDAVVFKVQKPRYLSHWGLMKMEDHSSIIKIAE